MKKASRKGWAGTGRRRTYRGTKFLTLRARYLLLVERQRLPMPPSLAEIVDRVPRKTPDLDADAYLDLVKEAVTWSDVDVLEEALIDVIPSEDLPEQLALARLTYSQTVAAVEYDQFERTMLDLSTTSPPLSESVAARLRSELLAVTQRTKYMLQMSPPKERKRASLSQWAMASMLAGILCVVVAYVLVWHARKNGDSFAPTESLLAVICAGLVGGFVSVQQRLQQPNTVDPLYKWLELDASGSSLLLSPIIGMVFAIVLFCIILGGFVTGGLFPSFLLCKDAGRSAIAHCAASDFASFAYASTPDSPASWAKLVVWAFAAGFLERLVPDILTRIAAVAEKS